MNTFFKFYIIKAINCIPCFVLIDAWKFFNITAIFRSTNEKMQLKDQRKLVFVYKIMKFNEKLHKANKE